MQTQFLSSIFWIVLLSLGSIHATLANTLNPNSTKVNDTITHQKDGKRAIFQNITSEQPLKIKIKTDLHTLTNDKRSSYVQAKIQMVQPNGEQSNFVAKVKPRGKTRRKLCDFPPLKLKFNKSELESNGFLGEYNKYKLVTHCKENKEYQSNVMKEYMIYKMYEGLTGFSYKARLVEIEYVDENYEELNTTQIGFVIEDSDHLADRLEMRRFERYGIELEEMSRMDYIRMAMFQYMIGNTDWKIKFQHNMKFLQDEETQKIYPIAYDFDYSGFINASYARPNPDLGQQHVQERFYQGCAMSEAEFEAIWAEFEAQKDTWYNQIDTFEQFSKRDRRKMKRYLDQFFATKKKTKLIKETFIATAEAPATAQKDLQSVNQIVTQ